MKNIINSTLLILMPCLIWAGPIEDEYFQVREQIEASADTPKQRKEQLEETLEKSLQRALLRHYDYANWEQIKITTDNYEQSRHDLFTYYVKYEDFVGFFSFQNNPELYLCYPREEKILKKLSAERIAETGVSEANISNPEPAAAADAPAENTPAPEAAQ